MEGGVFSEGVVGGEGGDGTVVLTRGRRGRWRGRGAGYLR